MLSQSKLFDISIGSCLIIPSCVGPIITGSPNVFINSLPASRSFIDIGVNANPICPLYLCLPGNPSVQINGITTHRMGDPVMELPAGVGVTVTGSPNVNS